MIGFWEDQQPIYADNSDVKCTVYKNGEKYLCCFANYGEVDTTFNLCGSALDGKTIFVPKMENFQEERILAIDESITLPRFGGIMLIVE